MTANLLTHKRKQGFSLMELLVVMAITVILLGLIFGPLVQGFNMTNRARVQVLAQATARLVMERVQRAVADGVFVFDNSGRALSLWVPDPRSPSSGGVASAVAMPIYYGIADLVPPARVNDQNPTLGNVPLDPTTGLPAEDARGPLALPVAPGRVIERYFLGLRDNASMNDAGGSSGRPIKPYLNFWENPRDRQITLDDHNPVLLYRAVFTPYTQDGQIDTRLINMGRFGGLGAALADPNFFYDNDTAPSAMPGWKDRNKDGQVNYSENWRAVATSMIPTDRADMVVATRDNSRKPVYFTDAGSGRYMMRLNTLAKFQPSYVGNDAGVPSSTRDASDEAPWVAPSTQVEAYGHWTMPFNAYVYRGSLNSPVLRYFYWNGSGTVKYIEFDTVSGTILNGTGEDTGFDPRRPSTLPGTINAARFLLFTVDEKRGVFNFAFPHWITQHGTEAPTYLDPVVANAEYAHVRSTTGNDANAYRLVSLLPRSADNPAGVDAGDNPDDTNPVLGRIANAAIVPGSETVTGPDMRIGPTYGMEVTYTRVGRNTDLKRLGPNQYVINYTNVANADLGATDPDSRAQAMRRAIQRAGTIIFSSLDDGDGVRNSLPETGAPIAVTYKVQNNQPGDVVKADYLTRQLMTFALSVRLYDFNSGQPQQMTLTQKIRVRNLQR